MGAVGVERQRVDDAAAGEGQPRLAGEERNLFRFAEGERMPGPAVEQAGIDSTPWGPSGPLDFNCNGATNDLLGPFHITGRGWYTDEKVCGESVHRDDDRVTDHDDWGKLRLYHRERFLSGDWPNAGLPFVCPFPG